MEYTLGMIQITALPGREIEATMARFKIRMTKLPSLYNDSQNWVWDGPFAVKSLYHEHERIEHRSENMKVVVYKVLHNSRKAQSI